MKIDTNTNISGLFLYSETAEYQDGDFVVFGTTLYVCSPKEGYGPGALPTSEHFYVYLGDKMADASDFIDFENNGGGEKKFVSLASLPVILNNYMAGVDMSGLINDSIGFSDAGELEYNILLSSSEVRSNSILTTLLRDEKINHGVFKVSRRLPEISAYVDGYDFDDTQIGLDSEFCILKQYSYLNKDNRKIRIQELIDPLEGNIFYRSLAMLESGETTDTPEWKFATANATSLKRKANKLFSVYQNRINGFNSRLEELQGHFCFKGIKTSRTEGLGLTLQTEDSSNPGYINPEDFDLSRLGPITLTLFTRLEDSTVCESNTITIDPSFGTMEYRVNDELSVKVTVEGVTEDGTAASEISVQNLSLSYVELFSGSMDTKNPTSTIELEPRLNNYSSGKILMGSDSKYISLGCSKLTNNIALDYGVSMGQYEKTTYTGFFTNPELEIMPGFGKNYDVRRGSDFTDLENYLISLSDLEEHSNPTIIIEDATTFKYTVTNNLSLDSSCKLYVPTLEYGVLGLSGQTSTDNEILGYQKRDDRGIYFYTDDLSITGIEVVYGSGNKKFVKISSAKDFKQGEKNYRLFGSFDDPIVSYKDLYLENETVSVEVNTIRSGNLTIKNTLSGGLFLYKVNPGTNTSQSEELFYLGSGDSEEFSFGVESGLYDIKAYADIKNGGISSITTGDLSSEEGLLTIDWSNFTDGKTYSIKTLGTEELSKIEIDSSALFLDTNDLACIKLQVIDLFLNTHQEISLTSDNSTSYFVYLPEITKEIRINRYKDSDHLLLSENTSNDYFFSYAYSFTKNEVEERRGKVSLLKLEDDWKTNVIELSTDLSNSKLILTEESFKNISLTVDSTSAYNREFNLSLDPSSFGSLAPVVVTKENPGVFKLYRDGLSYPYVSVIDKDGVLDDSTYLALSGKSLVFGGSLSIDSITAIGENSINQNYSSITFDSPDTSGLMKTIKITNNTGNNLSLSKRSIYPNDKNNEDKTLAQGETWEVKLSNTIKLHFNSINYLSNIERVASLNNGTEFRFVFYPGTTSYVCLNSDRDYIISGLDFDGTTETNEVIILDKPLMTVNFQLENLPVSTSLGVKSGLESKNLASDSVSMFLVKPELETSLPTKGYYFDGGKERAISISIENQAGEVISERVIYGMSSYGLYQYGSSSSPAILFTELEEEYSVIIKPAKVNISVAVGLEDHVTIVVKDGQSSSNWTFSGVQLENNSFSYIIKNNSSDFLLSTMNSKEDSGIFEIKVYSGEKEIYVGTSIIRSSTDDSFLFTSDLFYGLENVVIVISKAQPINYVMITDENMNSGRGELVMSLTCGLNSYSFTDFKTLGTIVEEVYDNSDAGFYGFMKTNQLYYRLQDSDGNIKTDSYVIGTNGDSDGVYQYGSEEEPLFTYEYLLENNITSITFYTPEPGTTTPVFRRSGYAMRMLSSSPGSFDITYGTSMVADSVDDSDTSVSSLSGTNFSVKISLESTNSKRTKIASAYYRKYYK